MRQMNAELRKSRRRYDFFVAALIGLIVLVWASQSRAKTADDLANGYSILFYGLPVMNTAIMPLGMAVLASRLWDLESKESNCKLLFTLQSRNSLYVSKALFGTAENLLICAIIGIGLLVRGQFCGFTEVLDLHQFWWLLACTFVINEMLFFGLLWLSILFSSLAPTLSAGMLGSLSGLFAAFFPNSLIRYFLPWSYYVPLDAMYLHWDPDTRVSWFEPVDFEFWLLGVAIVLTLICIIGGRHALLKKEV